MDHSGDSRRGYAGDVTTLRHTLIVLVLLAVVFLAWQLAGVLLLAFGAVIIAVVLRAFADLIARVTRLPKTASLVLAGLIVVGSIIGGIYFLGTAAAQQFADLGTRLSEMISRLEAEFNAEGAVERFVSQLTEAGPFSGVVSNIAGAASTVVGGLVDALLIAFGAAYLAADPDLYRRGVILLVPPSQRERAADTFDSAGRALRLWLAGQVLAMIVVGALITVGLMLIGMPSALALGLIAGVTNFVPFVGPVAAALPALLLAASLGGTMILWVLALYIVIQQLEGNFITPMIEQQTVLIPPAVTIFAIVATGVLFGPIGVVFGAPLTVIVYVAVNKLYLADTLGEEGGNHPTTRD